MAKPLFILVGLAIIFAFAVAWIASLVGLFYSIPFLKYLDPGHGPFAAVVPINLLFLIGIPLVSMVLFVARLAFGTRISGKASGAMWGFFIVNLISLFFFGSQVGRDFTAGADIYNLVDLKPLETDTLELVFEKDPYEYVWYGFGDAVKFTGKELVSQLININIEKSESGQFEIQQGVYSRGKNMEEATKLANAISFKLEQAGDKLVIPSNFILPEGNKWRNQQVNISLRIPEGKYVRLPHSSNWYYRDVDFAEGYGFIFNQEENTGTLYKMQVDGLACIKCEPGNNEEHFDFEYFSEVKVDGNIRVEIEKSLDDYEVLLQGKHELLENIDVMKLGETLVVSTQKERPGPAVVLILRMPSLTALSLANTKDVKLKGFEAASLRLDVKGQGDVKAFLALDSLRLVQNGRNVVDLRGNYGWLDARLSDHARLEAQQATIKKGRIDASSFSNANLPAIEGLEKKVEENSKVAVEGGG